MASKEQCSVCEKPFYGKQKSIRCGECDMRFHCSCVQPDALEFNVSATSGKCAYVCNSRKALTPDSTNGLVNASSNHLERLPTEVHHPDPCIEARDSFSAQLKAVRFNDICTLELVQSLVVMVTKLGCEVQQLRSDNKTLKTQLRDLLQVPFRENLLLLMCLPHVLSLLSLMPRLRHTGMLCVATLMLLWTPRLVCHYLNGLLFLWSTLLKEISTRSPVNRTTNIVNTAKKPRIVKIGARNSSLPVVQKRARSKSLLVSRFSPDITVTDVESSLRDQLQLASLICTRLKTKHNSYASFHISVSEDDFHLINNTDVWPNGCLIAPYYG
jgi:hypothetical protein